MIGVPDREALPAIDIKVDQVAVFNLEPARATVTNEHSFLISAIWQRKTPRGEEPRGACSHQSVGATILAETEIPENDRTAATPAAATATTATTSAASPTSPASGFCRRGASSHRDRGYPNGAKKINDNHGGRRKHAHELAAQTA